MNAKLINVLLILLLTVAVVINSGCGATRTNAQSRGEQQSSGTEISDSSKSAYKPEKRISKDVISKNVTPKTEKAVKSKKK